MMQRGISASSIGAGSKQPHHLSYSLVEAPSGMFQLIRFSFLQEPCTLNYQEDRLGLLNPAERQHSSS